MSLLTQKRINTIKQHLKGAANTRPGVGSGTGAGADGATGGPTKINDHSTKRDPHSHKYPI